MFKFNFEEEDNLGIREDGVHCENVEWNPSSEIEVTQDYEQYLNDIKINLFSSGSCKLKYVSPDISSSEESGVKEAVLQHSDLIPAKYEGGFKIWECTRDLVEYILNNHSHLLKHNTTFLDLGCGAGILGILALLHNCVVHFQDYNPSVINSFTIPNTIINLEDASDITNKKCRYFSGDWLSFLELIQADNAMYDIIATSETIYNPQNYHKLLAIFKAKLKKTGVVFLAAKECYFGVGGSLRQFESFIAEDGTFICRNCWSSKEGVRREIIQLKFQVQDNNLQC